MTDDFDTENYELLRDRVANAADSILWTYKAHFMAADYYRKRSRQINWTTTFLAALVTAGLVAERFPKITLALSIITAGLAGYKTAARPEEEANKHYNAGQEYHNLFEEFQEFIHLQMPTGTDLDALQEKYQELAKKRRLLNSVLPDLTSKWYEKLDDEIYSEIDTTEEAKERLTGVADRST